MFRRLSLFSSLLLLGVASAGAEEPGAALPAMNYFCSVAANELFDVIKGAPAFAALEKELVGSPIQLQITHTLQPTAGGMATGLLSAIWSGGTLGLLPMVTNNNLVLLYEVRVNGKPVVSYSYQRSFTRAVNIWSQNDPTHGLGKEGLEWARTTAGEFAAQAAKSPELLALAKEYAFYFGTESRKEGT